MNETEYQSRLEAIFVRFPSVQKTGFGEAYKPGLEHMEDFDALLGHPSAGFRSIHVAGTNGKGSVANMLASALAAEGLKVGLYTSPHILDFRERMRILDGASGEPARMIGKEDVWEFISRWETSFDGLDLSFFEITTGMAFWWFAREKVDLAVIEVGLGGRLDSTNIITPLLSIVTSIGLDHCAQLGPTRESIAGEKAGIFKPGVPAVVGTRDAETAPVFEACAAAIGCPLYFADFYSGEGPGDCPAFLPAHAKCSAIPLPFSSKTPSFEGTGEGEETMEELLERMDLRGEYQKENLRTVMCALGLLGVEADAGVRDAIAGTAARMDFHGRWEMLRRDPDILCDIGHNPPALQKNFAQLRGYLAEGRYDRLVIVYGVMADKDLDGILPLMPEEAEYIAVAPDTARALPAATLCERLRAGLAAPVTLGGSVADGISLALESASDGGRTLIYAGGSTFVVSEAIAALSSPQPGN